MKRLLAALLLCALVPAPSAHAVDVTANDATDAYEISGAVLLDGTYAEAREAAGCTDCHWRILRTCASGALEGRRGCLDMPCAAAADIAEVWRADGPSAPPVGDPAWTYRGMACLPDPPVAVAGLALAVRDFTTRSVPALRATSQPSTTTLTGLRTQFRSGQPASLMTSPATVAGTTVVVRAYPTWTWDFGHGTAIITSDPGGVHPHGRITHTYPRRGIYRVRVSCTWRAVYDARGITELPIDGVISQSSWFDLRVREARRYLRTEGT